MSDATSHDEASTAPDDDVGSDDGQLLWWGLPVLAWSILASILLHGLVAVPFVVGEFGPDPIKTQVEWIEEFEELESIGHGAEEGRWAEMSDLEPPRDDRDDKEDEPEDQKREFGEVEMVSEEEQESEEEQKSNDEPEFDEDEPREVADEEVAAEQPAADEPSQDTSRSESESSDADRDSADSGAFREDKPLPGVDSGGPSDIPDLKHYGPGNARVTALIRLDRIRGTEYEDSTRRLIEALPDFRILAESTGFDPIDDLDAFFMASADPRYIQKSFLAFRHQKTDRELKQILDNRFREPVPWQSRGDVPVRRLVPESSGYRDPRQIMLAKPGLTVVGEKDWLDEIAQNLPEDSALREHESSDDKPASATMLDGLAQIERAAAEEDTIAVLSAQGLAYKVPGVGRLTFEGVRLAITDPDSPSIDVDLRFGSEKKARDFEQECPVMKRKLKKGSGLDRGFGSLATNAMGIGEVLDKLRCTTEGDYVNIHADYTAKEARTLTGLGASFAPRPPSLNELPPPPAPEEDDKDGEDKKDEGDEEDEENKSNGQERENAAPGDEPESGAESPPHRSRDGDN
ncbi:MAG: hypothetical protein ACOCV2_05980 [Persicimonas sp.]